MCTIVIKLSCPCEYSRDPFTTLASHLVQCTSSHCLIVDLGQVRLSLRFAAHENETLSTLSLKGEVKMTLNAY